MVSRSRISPTRTISGSCRRAARKAEEKALALLSFFGVASPDQWQACYAEMHLELSYRKTAKAVGNSMGGT